LEYAKHGIISLLACTSLWLEMIIGSWFLPVQISALACEKQSASLTVTNVDGVLLPH